MKVGGSIYNSIHLWLTKNFGKANHCESESCTHQSLCFN